MTGTFGFNGYFKNRTAAPVRISIDNSGDMFDGWALANLESWIPSTYYTRPLRIPPGGSQEVEFTCFGCNYGSICEVPIELYTSDGDLLKTAALPSYKLQSLDSLVLYLGEPPTDLWTLFNGINPGILSLIYLGFESNLQALDYVPKIFPVALQPDRLPSNPLLLDGVALIVIDLRDYLNLTDSTKNLLLEYVRHGGNLLVYYREDRPVETAWSSEILLPVEPSGQVGTISYDSFMRAWQSVVPVNTFAPNLPKFILTLGRGVHGEIRQNYEEQSGPDVISQAYKWTKPDSYQVIGVSPVDGCETVESDEFPFPILALRKIGCGHAGFSALNPFKGGPAALDPPITLLAAFNLLDPYNPARRAIIGAPGDMQDLPTELIRGFFGLQSAGESWPFLRFIDSAGLPVFVYLLGLPLILALTRRRRVLAVALLPAWALAMTGLSPRNDRVDINEANLLWCEALPPDEPGGAGRCSSQLVSSLSYNVNNPIPRTVNWGRPNVILDEFVISPVTWPYGAVTIGEGPSTSLPDLPFEMDRFSSDAPFRRLFVYRRPAPEFDASGALEIGPDSARFRLEADIPFPSQAAMLVSTGQGLSVRKSLGTLDGHVSIDTVLEKGTDYQTSGAESQESQNQPMFSADAEIPDMGNLLNLFFNAILSNTVTAEQIYTRSQTTGLPGQAFIVMGSSGLPPDLTVSRGELTRRSLTIMVITVPIVYTGEMAD